MSDQPLRILYVGDAGFAHRAERYYSTWRKLFHGFVRLGHDVWFFSDRDEARAVSPIGRDFLSRGGVNRAFLAVCRNFRPDLVVLGHADLITSDALAEARARLPGVRIAQVNIDALWVETNRTRIAALVPHVDATFLTTGGEILRRFTRPGHAAAFIPNPVDPSIDRPRCHERSDQRFDVFFARRPKSRKADNIRVRLPRLVAADPLLAIDMRGVDDRPPVYGADYYAAIANARMGLNLSRNFYPERPGAAPPEDIHLYSSDRIAQYMGSGLLTFTTRENALETLFLEDAEIVFFSSDEECLDKLRFYKQNDAARRRIAGAGWTKSHAAFNERLVAQFILEAMLQRPFSRDYAWPTTLYEG